MTAQRGRLITASLVLLDLAAVAILGLSLLPACFFFLIFLVFQHSLRLYDPAVSPRFDSRILAGTLAFAGSYLIWNGLKLLGLGWSVPSLATCLFALALSQIGRALLGLLCQLSAKPVLIRGLGPRARDLARAIRRANYPHLRLLGFQAKHGKALFDLPLNPELPETCLVLDSSRLGRLSAGMEELLVVGDLKIRPAEGPGDGLSRALKRALDTLLILASLPLTLPLFILVLLVNRLVQGGEPLHRQVRVTHRSKSFHIYKFRSMPRDAEPAGTPIWPAAEDPRITAFGRILRGSWLDELPQLFNVLRGDLSLVGPRPERPEFVQVFKVSLSRYTERHRTRSGITGLAQVRGFVGNTSLRKRLLSDLQYLNSWSVWLDVAILGWTFCQAFKRQKRQRFDYSPGDEGPIP